MASTKLTTNDPRVERKTIEVRGKTYTYLLGKPEGAESETPKGTVFLCHGFPDTSFGWRYQIPLFQSLGYQVIAPNMLGYDGTSAPEDIESYTLKNISDDVAAICESILGPEEQIILGGHDWGGFLVWRIVLWHPKLVKAVFSICSPYKPPTPRYVDLDVAVRAGKLPHWRYQLQFASGEVEEHIDNPESIGQFIHCMWGARGANRELGFSIDRGVHFDEMPSMGVSPVLSEEEADEYVRAFSASGMRGPLNWYRNKKLVWEEEQVLVEQGRTNIAVPSLFILASNDGALPASLAAGMDKHFVDLTTKSIECAHWAMVLRPDEVNMHLKNWVDGKFGDLKASL